MIELITTGSTTQLQPQLLITLIFWIIMVCAVCIDLWTGVERARKMGEKLYSHRLRHTITKVGEYWRVQLMFLLFDIMASLISLYALPYASMLGTASIVAIELKSVFENLNQKRSAAADIPEMLRQIVQCKDLEGAKQLIEKLENKTKNPKS